MKIHLLSDTHMEQSDVLLSTAVADVYVLAGDIGGLSTLKDRMELLKYFDYCKKNAEHVIWVLGNHEFYGCEMEEAFAHAKDLASRAGVHLLDIKLGTENLELDGVKFWGTTFWSNCRDGDWFSVQKVQKNINDFYVIKNGGRPFSVGAMREINTRSRNMINWDADVIITHFPPMMITHPRYALNQLTYYFYNEGLEDQIHDSAAKLWLFGHTHHSVDIDMSGTLVVSNQHGYGDASWREAAGFDPNLILEI